MSTSIAVKQALPEEKTSYRQPPYNLEAEQALLGALLVDNYAYDKVGDFLDETHFYYPPHAAIYDAVRKLVNRGQIANPITLKTFFERDEALKEVGGTDYLVQLADNMHSVVDCRHYANIVYDLHIRRSLIHLGEDIVNETHELEVDKTATEHVEGLEQRLFDLATKGSDSQVVRSFGNVLAIALDVAEAAYKRDGSLMGLSTGLKDLDRQLGGLGPSDLLILAARPSMGKTAVGTSIAYNIARSFKTRQNENGETETVDGGAVAYFSLEMSSEQLALRILSEQSGVRSDLIRRGALTDEEFRKIVQAGQELSDLPLYIDDTPALTISGIRTRARRLKRQKNISLLVVDYLQLLQGSSKGRNENRVQEISEISRGLKAIAKELDIPVMALSQLSRAVEQREDKRPQLSDLRESGSIEQDADIVMFLYREQYYLERTEPMKKPEESEDHFHTRHEQWQDRMAEVFEITEVIVGKHRHGPVGKVKIRFNSQTTKFEDLIENDHIPEIQ